MDNPRAHHVRVGAVIGALVIAGAVASSANAGRTNTQPDNATATRQAASGTSASNRSDEWPITECGTMDGKGCAPTTRRVDLERPTFSNPTNITNPLFPVEPDAAVVQLGTVDGKPFRSETTTLPRTDAVDWYGTRVEVVLSQYVAWLDGRIEEVALDRYAQADDGSVWYFGEDVIDYVDGVATLTEGTWLAGRDGPPAMLMPARPKVGDVYRVENVIGIVFEELTVIEVDKTVDGPNGKVRGAIVVDELGVTGGHSTKTLAPGYGEFITTNDSEIEAVAVAVPINAIDGGVPLEIRKVATAAGGVLEYVRSDEWESARFATDRIKSMHARLVRTQQPPRVMERLSKAISALDKAVTSERTLRAEARSVDIAEAAIDLHARYLPNLDVQVARFHVHVQRLRVLAAADDGGGVMGELASLEHIADRLRMDDDRVLAEVDEGLRAARDAVESGSTAAAADHAIRAANDLRNLSFA